MIAPTPRPGHLAQLVMDDNGILLACDSRADLHPRQSAIKKAAILVFEPMR
jgi:hypothetical protein